MNSRKAHLTALLSAVLETPGGDSIVSPPLSQCALLQIIPQCPWHLNHLNHL